MNDFRFALRQLKKSPGFTAVAVLTLAFGIGVNLALFAVFNEQLLRPLNVAKPEEIHAILPADATGVSRFFNTPRPYYDALRESPGAFKQLVGYSRDEATLRVGDVRQSIRLLLVSGDYFAFLGRAAILGRTLLPSDEMVGAAPVAVISHRFWRRHFQGSPSVLGQTLELSGKLVEIVGVMPEDFTGMQDVNLPAELWAPARSGGGFNWEASFSVVGRLEKGISTRQAADSLAPTVRAVTERLLGTKRGSESLNVEGFIRVSVKPSGRGRIPAEWVQPEIFRRYGFAVVGTALVLLIAMSNLASLALSRVLRRRKEIATRIALGATPWTILRQLSWEGVLMAGLGAILAMLTLKWLGGVLPVILPATFGAPPDLHLDLRVVAAAFGMASVAGLGFIALPAWRAATIQPLENLKTTEGYGRLGERRWSWGRVLVGFQVGGSFVLLGGALLCLHAFLREIYRSPGFPPERLVFVRANLPAAGIADAAAYSASEDIQRRLADVPGVEAVGWFAETPFRGFAAATLASSESNWLPGYVPPAGTRIETGFEYVGPNGFQVLGIQAKQGRLMTQDDFVQKRLTAVVNEAFVRKFWPDQSTLANASRFFEHGITRSSASFLTSGSNVRTNLRDPRSISAWGLRKARNLLSFSGRNAMDTP